MPITRYPQDLEALLPLAEAQEGNFSAAQAAEQSITYRDLARLANAGHIERIFTGVYRLVRWPLAAHGDLWPMVLWGYSKQWPTVLSHRTALALYGVSDINPSRIDLTVGRHVRFRGIPPPAMVLHRRSVAPSEMTRVEGLPCTTLFRTLLDLIVDRMAIDSVEQVLTAEPLPDGLSEDERRRLRAVYDLSDKEWSYLAENISALPVSLYGT
jgi:predicted transcriptional regulator of viral defense system